MTAILFSGSSTYDQGRETVPKERVFRELPSVKDEGEPSTFTPSFAAYDADITFSREPVSAKAETLEPLAKPFSPCLIFLTGFLCRESTL